MAIHSNNLRYFRYSLPSFLEGFVDVSNKTIVIKLGPGEHFHIDYGLMFYDHDVVIKGAGKDKTKLKIDESDSYLQYCDDAIFNFQGDDSVENYHPISVRIEDLTIETNISKSEVEATFIESQPHSRIAHEESFLIKCYNVKSFVMRNVDIRTQNLATTCVNIRRGSNIDIQGCVFSNYNRRWIGGCVWLQGDMENVNIINNTIYKYGNDEAIAIWGSNNYVGHNNANTISKKNINITHNRIYCQDEDGGYSTNNTDFIDETVPGRSGKWSGCNQRFITVYTSQKDNVDSVSGQIRDTPCVYTINGLHINNNEFFINAPIDYLCTIAFDKHTTHKDISINNNLIKYGNWEKAGTLIDFSIDYDTLMGSSGIEGNYSFFSDEPFSIMGNTIICGCNSFRDYSSYSQDDHICLDINGVVILFNNNYINYTRGAYSEDEINSAHKGIVLFYTTFAKGGTVIFNENHCEGLMNLMNATCSDPNSSIPIIRLIGKGNYLYGNPRIRYNQVTESHVSLIGNEIISDYTLFLISEFANSGTVIFIGNRVHRELSRVNNEAKGQIFYTGNNNATTNITSLKFICSQNIFDNLLYASSMYNDFNKVSSIDVIHENNIFADTIE